MRYPRKCTSDSYWRNRVGHFVMGEVSPEHCPPFPSGKEDPWYHLYPRIVGKRFVMECLSWREIKAITGQMFAPKYGLRPMWSCWTRHREILAEAGLGNNAVFRFLRVEDVELHGPLTHEEAMATSDRLWKTYKPGRLLEGINDRHQ